MIMINDNRNNGDNSDDNNDGNDDDDNDDVTQLLLTNELLYNAERHYDEWHAEVSHGKRHEKIVGDALKFAFYFDRDADKYIASYTSRYQRQE